MGMSRHVWGATRAAVRPRFLRASQGCVVVCVYEYEIILSTIFPEIFPGKRVCSAGNGFRKNGYGPLEILSYAKPEGSHGGSQRKAAPVTASTDKQDTLTWPRCLHLHPLEHHNVRRQALLALTGSWVTVAVRCVLGILGESAPRYRL